MTRLAHQNFAHLLPPSCLAMCRNTASSALKTATTSAVLAFAPFPPSPSSTRRRSSGWPPRRKNSPSESSSSWPSPPLEFANARRASAGEGPLKSSRSVNAGFLPATFSFSDSAVFFLFFFPPDALSSAPARGLTRDLFLLMIWARSSRVARTNVCVFRVYI